MDLAIDKEKIYTHKTDALRVVKPPRAEEKSSVISFSSALKKKLSGTPNIIENFKQGFLNDCWLCAAAKSLSLTPAGRQQLNRMISKNADGSYTVTFASGKKFRVTEAELRDEKVRLPNGEYARSESMVYLTNSFPYIKAKMHPYITYSTGDKNLRLIEIAANKYVHSSVLNDVSLGYINKKDQNKFCLNNYVLDDSLLWGNLSSYPICAIDLGKLNAADIMYVATNSGSVLENLKWNGYEHHAYSVKKIDKVNKLIYLINPHDTKREPLCLSFKEFYKRFSFISLKGSYQSNYNKTKLPQNINNPKFIKENIALAERQTDSRLAQAYASSLCNMYKKMKSPEMQAKVIAQIIEYSSKGVGTHKDTFIGAVLFIDSKATLARVNRYLSASKNAEYKTSANNALTTYINEEFSFSTKTMLLNHIKQLR